VARPSAAGKHFRGETVVADVFISYSRGHRERVKLIADKLQALKLKVWFDAALPAGESFGDEIEREIKEAKCVLVCWTQAGIDSKWVRGEASLADANKKLVTCMLEPTELQPPFNEVHTEDLTHWEGEDSYAAWLKVLDRVGHFTERPGLAEYVRVMGEGGSAKALREWANQFGADELAAEAWTRVGVLEGESSAERIKREQREARARDERRRLVRRMAQRTRAGQGGQRSGSGALIAIALLGVVGAASFVGYRLFEAEQRNAAAAAALPQAQDPTALRTFLASYSDLPLASEARQRLAALDEAAWSSADQARTREALEAYLAAFPLSAQPPPTYSGEARRLLARARLIQNAQELLASLGYFNEAADGRMSRATTAAVRAFQTEASRRNQQITVTGVIDEDGLLIEDLTLAAAERARPVASEAIVLAERHTPPQTPIGQNAPAQSRPDAGFLATLVAQSRAPLSRADIEAMAAQIGVEWEALGAAVEVESGPLGGFDASGRPIILFERHLFSRRTAGRFDASNPNVSNRTPGGYPRTQDARWEQLREAFALDAEAALAATSFGRFQILGLNHASSGAPSVFDYVAGIAHSERGQLAAFVAYLRANRLVDALQRKDWAGFASRYNGPGYAANQYDTKLAEAYARLRANPIP
jgi:hypothetical protein